MIHGGMAVARILKREGVEVVFTLSGGHIAAIYDGCMREGVLSIHVTSRQRYTQLKGGPSALASQV